MEMGACIKWIQVISTILQMCSIIHGILFVPDLDNLQGSVQQPCPQITKQLIHCYPGFDCWPQQPDISKFAKALDGSLLLPNDKEYDEIVPMKNARVTKFPAMIMAARSTADIQRSLKWARSKSMRIVVQSSGHDYQGKSTADGAFMIYLGNMTEVTIKLKSDRPDCPKGEISLESGNQWHHVYQELDKVNRVMVGASATTVAIGGYTLGGGHSPISRMHGLAVDNLVEVEMVTADSNVVVANRYGTTTVNTEGVRSHSPRADLFWALRGGGGGTFGVGTRFTFRLHEDPQAMVLFVCAYPMYLVNGNTVTLNVVDLVVEHYFAILPDMPSEWGGYFFMSGQPNTNTTKIGEVSFYFNHFGQWNTRSRVYMDKIMNFRPDLQRYCKYENKTSFWDYEKRVQDLSKYRQYSIGVLAQRASLTKPFIDYLKAFVSNPENGTMTGLTATMLGGKMMTVGTNETSVHPGFRSAYLSCILSASWNGDGSNDDIFSNTMIAKNEKLRQFGDGSYLNQATGKNPTWKTDFWGDNYDRLARIKHAWDPDNVFMCDQCVGWDHWKN